MNKPEVIVITGASAGVGRATARIFAGQGTRIGLIARGRDGLEGTRREVEELGGQSARAARRRGGRRNRWKPQP
jgi:NADP-dependent 3-hydroxy acid dehydrogenase YdfG